MKTCTVERCKGRHHGRGLCKKHWMQSYRRTGGPLGAPTRRPFTPREDALLLSLPSVGRTHQVEAGRLAELAALLCRDKATLCNRRKRLLATAVFLGLAGAAGAGEGGVGGRGRGRSGISEAL